DGIHHQRRLHADKAAHARVAAFQFLRHQSVFHIRHARAAVALQVRAEKSQLGHGLDQFARKTPGAVALFDDRDEIVFNELARRIADQTLVVGEQRVEADEVDSTEFDGWHECEPLVSWGRYTKTS